MNREEIGILEKIGKMSVEDLEQFDEYCKLAEELDAVIEGR